VTGKRVTVDVLDCQTISQLLKHLSDFELSIFWIAFIEVCDGADKIGGRFGEVWAAVPTLVNGVGFVPRIDLPG